MRGDRLDRRGVRQGKGTQAYCLLTPTWSEDSGARSRRRRSSGRYRGLGNSNATAKAATGAGIPFATRRPIPNTAAVLRFLSMTSAGEVEQYAYCAHNWWLARQGASGEGEGSRRGVSEHRRLGGEQKEAEVQKRDVREGLRWSFRFLLVASSVTFLTLELLFLRQNPHHILFLTMAL